MAKQILDSTVRAVLAVSLIVVESGFREMYAWDPWWSGYLLGVAIMFVWSMPKMFGAGEHTAEKA